MAQISNTSVVNLKTIVEERVKSRRNRVRKLRKKRSNNKRKRNLYFKRKKLIRSLIFRKQIQKMSGGQDCSSMVSKSDKVWQQVDEVAFWKARAISLEYENKMLHKHVKQMYINQINYYHQETTTHQQEGNETIEPHQELCEEEYEEVQDDADDDNFNVETKLFRIERDKERERLKHEEQHEDEDESKAPTGQSTKEREECMIKLYGASWRRILGMETAVQLNYDLSLSKYKLKHWPVVPIKL